VHKNDRGSTVIKDAKHKFLRSAARETTILF
jgi:hypothetical protein